MKENALIKRFKEKLLKLKGLEKLYFLIVERDKLDKGIFSQSGWKGSEYKEELLTMLDNGDISDSMLEKYFDGYKDNWDKARCKFFDSTDTLEYQEFLKSFKEYLPQDIFASINKVKYTNLGGLKTKDSIRIFQNYYELRNWMNIEIQVQLDDNKLTDKEIQMMIGAIQDKYEWQGSGYELVGIIEHLESNKWLHNPVISLRNKAQLLHSCFTISGSKDSFSYIYKIYKENLSIITPFTGIKKKA